MVRIPRQHLKFLMKESSNKKLLDAIPDLETNHLYTKNNRVSYNIKSNYDGYNFNLIVVICPEGVDGKYDIEFHNYFVPVYDIKISGLDKTVEFLNKFK